MNKIRNGSQGFTLLELLVVVLIIGILAAIALPRYQESVEKSIMQEAIVNLKTIAEANERFYMINGKYATSSEIEKLDITIQGEIKNHSQTGLSGKRIMTKYFVYAANFSSGSAKAVAHRVKEGLIDYNYAPYYMSIMDNGTMSCGILSNANEIQRKLCTKIRNEGHL